MEDQFLYAELMPSIILIIVALACAEFIGRSKHIGFNYTLFMMLGIIPGIIALIFSPSAKKPPTKANKNYILFAVLFAIFSLFQLYKIQGEHDIPIATYMVMISFFATTFYFWDLQNGLVINKFPKYYFENNNNKTENSIEVFSDNNELSKIDSLNNLKEKGILTELEFIEKSEILNKEILQKQIKYTEEYKQLEALLNSKLLTKEEFENKVKILTSITENKNTNKETNNVSNVTANSYSKESKITKLTFEEKSFIGTYIINNKKYFYSYNNILTIENNNGKDLNCFWYINGIDSIRIVEGSKEIIYKNIYFSDGGFYYNLNNTKNFAKCLY